MARIVESIRIAKRKGATYRIGPELEVSGYGCEDHFLELDTFSHSFEVLAEILRTDVTDDILVDLGMPVLHKNIRYNARVLICNRQILLIRPKMFLANDGQYRESRWFFAWSKVRETEEFILPTVVRKVTGQAHCPIGDAIIQMKDTIVATESRYFHGKWPSDITPKHSLADCGIRPLNVAHFGDDHGRAGCSTSKAHRWDIFCSHVTDIHWFHHTHKRTFCYPLPLVHSLRRVVRSQISSH